MCSRLGAAYTFGPVAVPRESPERTPNVGQCSAPTWWGSAFFWGCARGKGACQLRGWCVVVGVLNNTREMGATGRLSVSRAFSDLNCNGLSCRRGSSLRIASGSRWRTNGESLADIDTQFVHRLGFAAVAACVGQQIFLRLQTGGPGVRLVFNLALSFVVSEDHSMSWTAQKAGRPTFSRSDYPVEGQVGWTLHMVCFLSRRQVRHSRGCLRTPRQLGCLNSKGNNIQRGVHVKSDTPSACVAVRAKDRNTWR